MDFSSAMRMASPMLLGMASDMEGRTSNGMALGAAKMQSDQQAAERKAAISKLLGEMSGISPTKAALIDTLPVEAQQQVLLNHMNQQEALARSQAAAGASAARKAAEAAAFQEKWQQLKAPNEAPAAQAIPQWNTGLPAPTNAPTEAPALSFGAPVAETVVATPSMYDHYRNVYGKALHLPPGSTRSALLAEAQKHMDFHEPKKRESFVGADGYRYFADTQERVFPNVQKPVSETVSAREAEINRGVETHGLSRERATLLADGNLTFWVDPDTQAPYWVNKVTQEITPANPQQVESVTTEPEEAPTDLTFGEQYQNSPSSFGVAGFGNQIANKVTDTLGLGPWNAEVQQTQADFDVLSEKLVNDMASAYQRQPPSWLLQNIAALSPRAGRLSEGAGEAQTKLRAIGRDLSGELNKTNKSLQRRQKSKDREVLLTRKSGLEAAIERIETALQSFGGLSVRPEVLERMKEYQ